MLTRASFGILSLTKRLGARRVRAGKQAGRPVLSGSSRSQRTRDASADVDDRYRGASHGAAGSVHNAPENTAVIDRQSRSTPAAPSFDPARRGGIPPGGTRHLPARARLRHRLLAFSDPLDPENDSDRILTCPLTWRTYRVFSIA